jgi:hypothetical protein
MLRTVSLTAACALALAAFCAAGRAQDASPSLGDVARQAQKDKASKPAAKVITNDDLSSSGSGSISTAPGGGAGHAAPGTKAAPAAGPGEPQTAEAGIAKLQAAMAHLDSLDRAALVAEVLQGNSANFPGRAQWEGKMFSAKQTFVSQLRVLIQAAGQIEGSARSLKGVQDPNDPRVKALNLKLQQLMQATIQDTATFEAVAEEGKDLAGQSAAH